MNCYFHPQVEGVVTCGKCGVAMCRECESNAFFRLDGGKGQALCNRCSLSEAQANVDFDVSWLKKRMVKLIFCTIFVVAGLIAFLTCYASGDVGSGIFTTIILWAIAGVIANFGHKKNNGSVKSQVRDAAFEYEHPVTNMIFGILFNAIFGPILLISHFVGYARTKSQYKNDLQDLEILKSKISE